MKKHTVHYKDKLGRKNKADLFGNDEFEVKEKLTRFMQNVL
jgi:hypothetical protein